MQIARRMHHAERTALVAAPLACMRPRRALRRAVRQLDASPARAAYLKSP